jgi:hypothetical protein
MSVTMVKATIKPDKTAEMEKAGREMFAAIEAAQPQGVRYASCKLADGETYLGCSNWTTTITTPRRRACLPGLPRQPQVLARRAASHRAADARRIIPALLIPFPPPTAIPALMAVPLSARGTGMRATYPDTAPRPAPDPVASRGSGGRGGTAPPGRPEPRPRAKPLNRPRCSPTVPAARQLSGTANACAVTNNYAAPTASSAIQEISQDYSTTKTTRGFDRRVTERLTVRLRRAAQRDALRVAADPTGPPVRREYSAGRNAQALTTAMVTLCGRCGHSLVADGSRCPTRRRPGSSGSRPGANSPAAPDCLTRRPHRSCRPYWRAISRPLGSEPSSARYASAHSHARLCRSRLAPP